MTFPYVHLYTVTSTISYTTDVVYSKRTTFILSIFLLLLFATSCNQLTTAQAEENLRRAIPIFTELDDQKNLWAAYIYEARGDIGNFATAMRTERTLRDKLFAEQSNRVLHEMQVQYETEITALQLAQKTEEIRNIRLNMRRLTIILVLITALLIGTFIFHQYKMQEVAVTVHLYEELLRQKKKEVLQQDNDSEQENPSKKLAAKLKHLFQTEKTYRQQGLLLDNVAKMLQTNSKYLSSAIKENFEKNFVEFVNTYRVEEAIEILKKQEKGDEYAHYSIEMIAEAVGFNSKNPFYEAFKRVVGITPREYMNQLNKRKTLAAIEEDCVELP